MERDIKITRNYSFWKHPIKWFKDRKKILIMDLYVNHLWENGMKDEFEKMSEDVFLYGSSFMDKKGKRIDPRKFQP